MPIYQVIQAELIELYEEDKGLVISIADNICGIYILL